MRDAELMLSSAELFSSPLFSEPFTGQPVQVYGPHGEALALQLATSLASPSMPVLAVGSSEHYARTVQQLIHAKLANSPPAFQQQLTRLGMQLQLPGASQNIALLPARLDRPSPRDSESFELDLNDLIQALIVASGVDKKYRKHAAQALHGILSSSWRDTPTIKLADIVMQLNSPPKSIAALPGRIGTMRNAAKACALGLNQLLTNDSGLWGKGELLNLTDQFNRAPLQFFLLSYLPIEQRHRYVSVLLHRFNVWLRQQPPRANLSGILVLGELNTGAETSYDPLAEGLLELAAERGWLIIRPKLSKKPLANAEPPVHRLESDSEPAIAVTDFLPPLQPTTDAATAIDQQSRLQRRLSESTTMQPVLPIRQVGPAQKQWYLCGELELHYLIPRLGMRHQQTFQFRVPVDGDQATGLVDSQVEQLDEALPGVLLDATPADCPWIAYDQAVLDKAQQRVLKISCKQFPLTLYRCPRLKLVSLADEDETAFTQRIKANLKQEQQAALDDIDRRHARTQQRIALRLQRAEKRLKALRQQQRRAKRRNLVRQIVGRELENELLEDLFKQRQARVEQMQQRLDQLNQRRQRAKQEKRAEFASQEYLVKTTQISANSKKSKIRLLELQRTI